MGERSRGVHTIGNGCFQQTPGCCREKVRLPPPPSRLPLHAVGSQLGRAPSTCGWASREAKAQWRDGEWPVGEGKRKWVTAGPKTGAGPNSSNKTFLNFYLEFEFLATLEICTWRFRRDFDIGIFPKIFWAFLGFLEMKMNYI
jgi:hypothetical protein